MKIALSIKIYLLFLFFCYKSTSQTNSIVFTYDNGGNIIQRNVIVVPNISPPNAKFSSSTTTKTDSTIQFKVYPNPTKEVVNIDGELPKGIESAKVFLFNNTGQVLKTDIYSGTSKTIYVNDLKAGIYYLEVNYSKDRSSNYKIIITN